MSKKDRIDPAYGEVRQGPYLNADGAEVLSSAPMAVPTHMKRPETLAEQVARLVRSEAWKQRSNAAGVESFDDADDFDIPDDPVDPSTPFEVFFDHVLQREVSPEMFQKHPDHFRTQYTKALVDSGIADEHIDKSYKKASKRFWHKKSKKPPEKSQAASEPSKGQ